VEKRKFERVALNEPVVVEGKHGERVVGSARDVSIGGMFVEGVSATFGAHVIVHLHLPSESAALALPAVVRWVHDGGVGVQFGLLGARETHALTEAIARASPSHTRERAAEPVEEIDVDVDVG